MEISEAIEQGIEAGEKAIAPTPIGVAHIPIGVGADADHIAAVKLLGDAAEARILEQTGIEGRPRMQHGRPIALFARKGLVFVDVVKLGLVFPAQGFDLFRREQVMKDDEPEGSEMIEL